MTAATSQKPGNPFPGLRPFRDNESHLFFGRESQVDTMIDKLARTRFLAVVGTSGSGKSSLVNCGLRPALHRGLMARAGTSWRMAQFRPGSDPLRAMACALGAKGVLFGDLESEGLSLEDMIEASLRMSRLGLSDVYQQANPGDGVNLLLVADQFEELFRYRTLGAPAGTGSDRGQDAKAFVNLLLEANTQDVLPIYIVITMRSDFLGDCAELPGLPEAMNQGQYLVPRLTREERRAAIAGPVGVGSGKISPVLLTRLVNDVGDNPDQLSILQHALNRTWARWQHECQGEGQLEPAHYEAIGAMAHALDQHAEKAFSELTTERERQICQKIFKALTNLGTDARGTRRPLQMSTLCSLASATPAEVTNVTEVFRKPSRSFLMPPLPEVLAPHTVIDISHESLMRVWERLKAWAEEEAQSAQLYRRLAETAALHAAGKAALWHDPDLQLALQWRERERPARSWAGLYGQDFECAMDFLTQSETQQQADVRDQETRKKRELEQAEQARAARRLRWVVPVIAGLGMLALMFGISATQQRKQAQAYAETARHATEEANKHLDHEAAAHAEAEALRIAATEAEGVAVQQRTEAQQQGGIARARELASQSDLLRNTGTGTLETSALLAIESMRKSPVLANDLALRRALALLPQAGAVLPVGSPVSLVAFRSDGRVVARASNGPFHLFNAADGKDAGALNLKDALKSTILGVEGHLLAAAEKNVLEVLDIDTGEERFRAQVEGTISAVAVSPGDLYAACSDESGILSIFETGSGKRIAEVRYPQIVGKFAISADGGRLAVAPVILGRRGPAPTGEDVHRIDVASQKEIWKFQHRGAVTGVAFSRNGAFVATASADGTARVIDAGNGSEVTRMQHAKSVSAVAFSPDGQYVASASQDTTARIFDANTGREISRMSHPAALTALAFSADGRSLVTASGDAARIFGFAAEKEVSRLKDLSFVQAWALSPDGLHVATSDQATGGGSLFDADTGAPLRELKNVGAVNDVAFSPDSRFLTTASAGGAARVFEVATGNEICSVSLSPSLAAKVDVYTSTISWDSRFLATASSDQSIRIFDIRSRKETSRFKYERQAVVLAFSPDGKLLAAGDDKNLSVFRLDGRVASFLPHGSRVNYAVFSSDGRHLATSTDDGFARVFDTKRWMLVSQLKHQGGVPQLAFSRDGRYVLTGSRDNTARMFETTTGKEVARLEHADGIQSVAFRAGGRRIIALSLPIISSHWLRPSDLILEACSRMTQNLDPEEWQQYMGDEPYRKTCPNLNEPGNSVDKSRR